jgi:hypothetical protein
VKEALLKAEADVGKWARRKGFDERVKILGFRTDADMLLYVVKTEDGIRFSAPASDITLEDESV